MLCLSVALRMVSMASKTTVAYKRFEAHCKAF
jgi:hypothetical protein